MCTRDGHLSKTVLDRTGPKFIHPKLNHKQRTHQFSFWSICATISKLATCCVINSWSRSSMSPPNNSNFRITLRDDSSSGKILKSGESNVPDSGRLSCKTGKMTLHFFRLLYLNLFAVVTSDFATVQRNEMKVRGALWSTTSHQLVKWVDKCPFKSFHYVVSSPMFSRGRCVQYIQVKQVAN